jgi:hypothetical protein
MKKTSLKKASNKVSSNYMTFAQAAVGEATKSGRTWFIAEEDDLFRVVQYKDEKWLVRTPDWPIVSVCGNERKKDTYEVIALGINGELLVGTPGEFIESELQKECNAHFEIGPMRDIIFVGESVFAAGMNRQVFERKNDAWTLISTDIHTPKNTLAGFNSIHGMHPNAVYAVGFEGEIWFYNGTNWKQIDSPTSVVLNRVIVAPNGIATICGAGGTLLQVNTGKAVIINNNVTQDNLYGITIFQGKVYVSSLTALFEITTNGLQAVEVIVEGNVSPFTFGNLDANEKTMWSVGVKHLLRTNDGIAWELVVCDI